MESECVVFELLSWHRGWARNCGFICAETGVLFYEYTFSISKKSFHNWNGSSSYKHVHLATNRNLFDICEIYFYHRLTYFGFWSKQDAWHQILKVHIFLLDCIRNALTFLQSLPVLKQNTNNQSCRVVRKHPTDSGRPNVETLLLQSSIFCQ